MLHFRTPTLRDLPLLQQYTEKALTRNCEFAIANVFFWNNLETLQFAIVDEVLVYRTVEKESVLYSPLELSMEPTAFLSKLFDDAAPFGKPIILNNLSDTMIETLSNANTFPFSFAYSRDNSDYVYLVSDLITLSGSKYHGKKNHLNKFRKTYDYRYERITPGNLGECLAMAEKWQLQKHTKSASYEQELTVLSKAFSQYEEFGFLGALIRIQGEVVAFTFGHALTKETFVTHFEKAYEDIPGLYQIINQQFAEQELSAFTYVNREDDMGIEGLRYAKLSYHPIMLVNKYSAKLLQNETRLH